MASTDGEGTRRRPAAQRETPPTEAISVRVLIEQDVVRGASVAAGAAGIDRPVSRFNVMSVPRILPWVKPDEFLLLTGYPLPRTPTAIAQLLRELDARGVAGVGIKFDEWVAARPSPLAALLTRSAAAQVPVGRRSLAAYDDAAGLTTRRARHRRNGTPS